MEGKESPKTGRCQKLQVRLMRIRDATEGDMASSTEELRKNNIDSENLDPHDLWCYEKTAKLSGFGRLGGQGTSTRSGALWSLRIRDRRGVVP